MPKATAVSAATNHVVLALAGLVILVGSGSAHATPGKILVTWDEWLFNDDDSYPGGDGFSPPNDPAEFAANIAHWFTGGASGSFLGYTADFRDVLNDPAFVNALAAAGHSYTRDSSGSPTLGTFQSFDGIFLAGPDPVFGAQGSEVLIDYVNSGGNVVVLGGYFDDATDEAAQWNPFLEEFGLRLDTSYSGSIATDQPITCMDGALCDALFTGVDHLFHHNNQAVFDLDDLDPRNIVLVSEGGRGSYAVFVPEPSTSLLVAFGLSLIARRARQPRGGKG